VGFIIENKTLMTTETKIISRNEATQCPDEQEEWNETWS
jgi:hypothetical protein